MAIKKLMRPICWTLGIYRTLKYTDWIIGGPRISGHTGIEDEDGEIVCRTCGWRVPDRVE